MTEPVLYDILTAIQAQTAAVQRISGGAPAGGGDGGAPAKAVSSAMLAASKAIAEMSKVALSTVSTIINLGKAAQDGDASISQTMNALSGLPFGLGQLASAASFAASVLEKNAQTQENLSRSGANFGGNLDLIRQSAAKSYLSLDQFANVVRKNQDVFSSLGGNAQEGVEQFTKIQNTLLAPNSSTARNLATLGYSFEDAANLTASYIRSQGTMNKAGLDDTKKVAAGVQEYAQELSLLSSITGESREAIQKKMDEENSEAQWQSALAEMAPDKAAKLRQGMEMAMAQGGKPAMEAFKAIALGLPPMTEGARLYTATQAAGVASLQKYNDNANNAGISTEKAAEMNRKALAKQIADGATNSQQFQTALRASALEGGKLAGVFADSTKLQTKFKGMSEAQISTELEKMAAESKREKSQASDAKEQQKAMMDLTNMILAKMMPAFNFFLDLGLKAAGMLGELAAPLIDFGGDFIKNVVSPFFSNIFGKIDLKGMIGSMMDFVKVVFTAIDWKTVGGILSTTIIVFKDTLMIAFDAIKPIVMQIVGLVNGFLPTIIPIIQDIGIIIQRIFQVLSPLLKPIIDGIGTIIGGFFSMFGGMIKVIKGLLTGDFKSVFEGIGDIFGGFFTRLWGILKTIYAIASGGIRAIWNFLSGGTPTEEKPTEKPKTPTTSSTSTASKTETSAAAPSSTTTPAATTTGNSLPVTTVARPPAGTTAAPATTPATTTAAASAPTTTAPPVIPAPEKLLVSMETLNKQTADILKVMREVADHARRNVDATKSLNKNLFAT